VRHRPAHAIPSPGRTKRFRIRGHDGARHARISVETRRSLAELRQRVTRIAHSPRIADSVARTRALRVALFICVISTGFITAVPSQSSDARSPMPAPSLPHRPPLETASDSTASRLSAGKQPPTGAAPETATTPPVGGPRQEQRSPNPRGGLTLEIQGTPPAPDDPDLEHALSDLDRQADLDQQLWQQRGLGDQPPQSSPSTTAAPNAKPSGTHSGQPTSSRWVLRRVAEPHSERATREET
jgi:hypothetical protein